MSIAFLRSLLYQRKYAEARDEAMEMLYYVPNCRDSLLVLFESSLALGDEHYAKIALKELGFSATVKERKTLNNFINARIVMKAQYHNQNYEESLKHAKIALEVAPASCEVKVYEAKCYIRLEMPVLAKGILEQLLAEYPDNEIVNFQLGVAYLLLGRYNEALKLVRKAVDAEPDNKKYREIKVKLEKSLEAVKKAKTYEEVQDYERAVYILTTEIEKGNHQKAWTFELLIMRAKIFKLCRKFEKAIKDINEALGIPDVYSDTHAIYLLRSQCQLEARSFYKCIDDCRYFSKNSDDPAVEILIQDVEKEKIISTIVYNIDNGNIKKAYDISFKSYQESRNEEYLIFSVQCARAMKDWKLIKSLMHIIEKNPLVYEIVSTKLIGIEDESLDAAQEELTIPEEFATGLALYNAGHFGKCIEVLEKMEKENLGKENFPQMTLDKAKKILQDLSDAVKFQESKNIEAALAKIEEAMEIEKCNPNIQQRLVYCRGRFYFDAKMYEEALNDFNKVSLSDLKARVDVKKKECVKEIRAKNETFYEIKKTVLKRKLAKH